MQHLLKGMSVQRAWTPMLIIPCPGVTLHRWVPAAEQMWSHEEKYEGWFTSDSSVLGFTGALLRRWK